MERTLGDEGKLDSEGAEAASITPASILSCRRVRILDLLEAVA